jgi:hypothetical protein
MAMLKFSHIARKRKTSPGGLKGEKIDGVTP